MINVFSFYSLSMIRLVKTTKNRLPKNYYSSKDILSNIQTVATERLTRKVETKFRRRYHSRFMLLSIQINHLYHEDTRVIVVI